VNNLSKAPGKEKPGLRKRGEGEGEVGGGKRKRGQVDTRAIQRGKERELKKERNVARK